MVVDHYIFQDIKKQKNYLMLYLLVSENMASDINFVTYILDQLEGIEDIASKEMFGEYATLFSD